LEGYKTINIPANLHKVLKEIVEDKDSLYVSISDLAKEALREKIITIRSQNPDWK